MGSIVINGMRIRDSRPHGLLSVADILAESSDVGSIKIGMRLGDERFYKYIRAFGFGQQTGIELPGETRGLTKPPDRWSKVSFAAISMGQEIGITPLQLAGAGFDHGERWRVGGAEDCGGNDRISAKRAADDRVSSRGAAARYFAAHRRADATDDAGRGVCTAPAERRCSRDIARPGRPERRRKSIPPRTPIRTQNTWRRLPDSLPSTIRRSRWR